MIGILVIAVAVQGEKGLDSGGGAAPSATVRPGSSGSAATAAAPTGSALPAIALVTPTVASPHGLEAGRTIGRTDAPATLVVWGDFQCPYCGTFTRETEPRLYSDYVIPGKLKIIYRDWVFIGPESVSAAAAARCAGDQGSFWPYHDYLLWNQHGENQGAFRRDRLDAIAAAIGLDLFAFRDCMAKPAAFDAVRAETEAGSQAGIGMTPTLVVDGQIMPGAVTTDAKYASLRSIIDASIAAHSNGAGEASPTQP